MPLFPHAAMLASVVTAPLTTSIWMPVAANANRSFARSVVTPQGDRTTISVNSDGNAIFTDYGTGPRYATVGGTTCMTYEATAIDHGSTSSVTVDLAYSQEDANAVPTCTMTVRNSDSNIESSYCSILEDNPESTYVVTDTPRSDDGDGLLVPSAATETVANGCTGYFDSASSPDYHDYERRRDFINNYKLFITAGRENFNAAAAATPTGNSAQSIPVLMNSTAGSSGIAQASAAAASIPPSFCLLCFDVQQSSTSMDELCVQKNSSITSAHLSIEQDLGVVRTPIVNCLSAP